MMFLNNLYTNIVQTKINGEVIRDIDYKSLLTNGDNHLYIISTRNSTLSRIQDCPRISSMCLRKKTTLKLRFPAVVCPTN